MSEITDIYAAEFLEMSKNIYAYRSAQIETDIQMYVYVPV